MSSAKNATPQIALPPGPRSLLPWKVFRSLRLSPLDFLTRLAAEHGDMASFKVLGQQYVIINDPELARTVLMGPPEVYWKGPALQNSKGILGEGLLTAEGEDHRGQRRLMQSAFHAKHVETYAGAIVESTQELITAWQSRLPHPGTPAFDIRPEMMGLTLVIAGRALFGTFLADDVKTIQHSMDELMNNYRRAVVPWGKLLNRLPLPSTRRLARARNELFGLVDRMIAQRRTQSKIENEQSQIKTSPDLLSMMIAATDDPAPGCPHASRKAVRLTDTQLRDQSITILTAGHETTANALTFTLYLLAQHPHEQEQLRREVASVIGTSTPTVEMLDHLPRTRWVLSEAMRLFPPAWTLGRQNQIPVALGGFHLPAKCTILIPQWTLHRNPRYWDAPLTFNPDRWQNPSHPRFAYLPFSTGHRNCIGESFAWLEMMLVLPMLVQACRFAPAQPEAALELTPAITLRPRNPVLLTAALLQ